MHEKCQILMRKCDRETRAKKRMSMDYEQVMWRMSQSEYGGSTESLTKRQLSRSPTRGDAPSPGVRRRNDSPNSNSEVTMRVKKRNNSAEGGDVERKLRSRSATFVLEKDEDLENLRSSPKSMQSSPYRQKRKGRRSDRLETGGGGGAMDAEEEENRDQDRMCRSAGAELITAALDSSGRAWSITMTDSQSSAFYDEGLDSLPMGSTGGSDMAASYARSISGVSDSGVYDSLTRSDMLNSSIISTDSEWMASANVSMNLDANGETDLDPFTNGHQKVTNSDTVLDMSKVNSSGSTTTNSNNAVTSSEESSSGESRGSRTDADSSFSSCSADVTVCHVVPPKPPHRSEEHVASCDRPVSLDNSYEDDNVFADKTVLSNVNTGKNYTPAQTHFDNSNRNSIGTASAVEDASVSNNSSNSAQSNSPHL